MQAAIAAADMGAVAKLVVTGTSTRIRQAAAHAIDDPDLLRQLIRDTRGGNDKGVYKVLTSKRDLLLEETRKLTSLRAEIDAASEALERHSQRAHDALYGSYLDQFERRWEAVAAQADPALISRVQLAIARARETVAEHLRQTVAQEERDLAAAKAAADAHRLREQQEQEAAAAAAEQQQVFLEQTQALVEMQQAEQQPVRQIGGLIRKARDALNAGNTSHASAVRRAIDEKLVGTAALPENLSSQIQQLDHQLAELKDWKSFSVAPKRAELIAEMELLIGAALDPLALAERIKCLQDEWRGLSKGVGETVEADWQRFQQAAQKAYQPCSEYFAAQALVREENRKRRDDLLAGLTAFEAEHPWERPDWRAVIQVLRESNQAWRRCIPVDRLAGKQQQDAFVAVTASLQGRLDAEYARNLKEKESLIERARALLGSDDGRKAIDVIKDLQKKWQTVGPVPREVDNRLWVEFRQHSDAVFEKRQQDFASYAAGLEGNKAQAIALCEQLEKIAALNGSELLDSARGLAELQRAFSAIGEFPRADANALRGRFDQGLERCEASIASQHARDTEHSWSDLFEAANHLRTYRLAVARGLDAEHLDTLKRAAESCIASVPRWPNGGLPALKRALASEPSNDLAANETTLKTLCIRAEILTDLQTPPEDQALRRAYQLQRLVQGMGQGVRADDTNLDTMAIEWVAAGPVEAMTYEPLLQRFLRCRERRNASVP